MLISVFTPVHESSSKFISSAYNSLKEQTYKNWEWVIVLNNCGYVNDEIKND